VSDWRSLFRHTVHGPDDAVAFINAVGFSTWLPLTGLDFPNLAEVLPGEPSSLSATEPDRPGAGQRVDAHHVMNETWFWKDDLHIARRVYYAKVIGGHPSFIAPDFLPDFFAAIGGMGQETERDPIRLYREGRLAREGLLLYQHLVEHPAQATRELRRGTGGHARDRSIAIEKALVELQRRFVICKIDISGRTRGTYSYVWDLVERFCPEAFEEARRTPVEAARDRIRQRLADFGVSTNAQLEGKLFWWR
jgi:hypothetical protein